MPNITIITSTKQDEDQFKTAALHSSILDYSGILDIHPVCNHTGPIADAYNRFLTPVHLNDYLVFMHADASIKAPRFQGELEDAFRHYDIVGVAGSTQEFPDDVSWAFKSDGNWKDGAYLSGSVFHTDDRCYGLSTFGPSPAECEMLDGVFLALNAAKVIPTGIRFDPQFNYDFYDLDFCRQARQAGLRLGTWPFKVTHSSGGRFGSLDWQQSLKLYKTKWS